MRLAGRPPLPQGCVKGGRVDTARKVHGQLQAGGLEPNAHTHHLQVDAGVVAGAVWVALLAAGWLASGLLAVVHPPRRSTHRSLLPPSPRLAGNVPAMMQALAALQAAGHTPKLALLERCLARSAGS